MVAVSYEYRKLCCYKKRKEGGSNLPAALVFYKCGFVFYIMNGAEAL